MLVVWIVVFVVALIVLVKGADYLIEGAEKIGLSLGLSPFIVGVTIVGVGTSFPELVSSLFAAFRGVTEVVAANAIGSNIANILLIVGVAAVVGKRLTVTKSLIDLDLPLLAASTALLLGAVWDREVTRGESILMLSAYGVYVLYTALHKDADGKAADASAAARPKVAAADLVRLAVGILGLVFGAKYLIDALINLSAILDVATGVIAITAVAIGTSLPELLVSVKAARRGKSEVALGNIFGSNVFNALAVVGIPGLFHTLSVDAQTFSIGVPVLIVATLLFVISGISKRIHLWEGAFFLILYLFFIAKLFAWF